ncbi:MAG: signal peptidase II [Ignavibacteriales bacterium]
MLILATGAATFLLDLASKKVVKSLMTPNQSIPIIPNVFHLTYVLNPGAAFGLFAYKRIYFILVTVIVIVLILIYGKRFAGNSVLLQLSLGLELGGALGNLVDRVIIGRVVDFLDLRVWPVFNVADSAIVIGVALFAMEAFLGRRAGCKR